MVHVTQLCSYLRTNPFHGVFFDAIAAAGVAQRVVSPHRIDGAWSPTMESAGAASADIRAGDRGGWSLFHKLFYSRKVHYYTAFLQGLPPVQTNVVHAHSVYADGFAAQELADRSNVPLVLTVRNGDVNLFPKTYPHWRGKARALVQRADRLVFVNHHYAAQLADRLGAVLDPARCSVIPNGASDPWHTLMARSAHAMPATRIVCTGKLMPLKNQLGLIEATARVRHRTGLDLRLTLIGAPVGRYGEDVQARCEELPWCQATGPLSQSRLIDTYAGQDVFALASHTENFGIVYAEALLAGLPVLYSRGQGFDGWPSPSPYGVAVDSRDPDSIATGLTTLCEAPDRFADSAGFARRTFSWASVAGAHEQLYRDLIRT